MKKSLLYGAILSAIWTVFYYIWAQVDPGMNIPGIRPYFIMFGTWLIFFSFMIHAIRKPGPIEEVLRDDQS